jgi:F-type H+-transporting ATPase subunit epsilon
MTLEIITPEKIIFSGDIDELIVPTVTGEIAILPHHVDLLSQLAPGEIIVKANNKPHHIAVTGGFLQITNDKISLLADYAVRSEDINAQKALEAQRQAEEILKKKKEGISEQDFAIAQNDLRRAVLELKVANKRRRGSQMPTHS